MVRSKAYVIILLILLATNLSATTQKQDEINILFIGNSFTARHNLSELVQRVIEEGKPNLKVNVNQVIYGGQSLFQHTEYYFSETFIEQGAFNDNVIEARIKKMEDYLALEETPDKFIHFWKNIRKRTTVPDFPKNLIEIAIKRHKNLLNNNPETKWDYVVLQSWMDEIADMNDGYAKYAKYLANVAKEQGAEVILYITAPDIQNQAPVTGPLKQDNVDQKISFVLELANEIEPYAVVHVPLAINMIQEGGTELTFRYVNDFHPNQRTAFLTTNMFYAAFFNESSEGFDFNSVTENNPKGMAPGQDPDGNPATLVFEEDEKTYLQQMAYNAVIKFNQWWKGENPIPVTEISIVNAPADTIDLGKNYQLHVSIKPLYATNKSVTWEVTSGNAVSVDENGLLKTLTEGKAIVKATSLDGGFSDSCEIAVKKKVISVYGIMISNCPNYILKTGDTHQLVANIAPADATKDSVTWSSSNTVVAIVDETGLVSAITQGSVKIAVITNDGGHINTCNIGVMSSTTDMPDLNLKEGIKIYPNPVYEKLHFEFAKEDIHREITIYDMKGRMVHNGLAKDKYKQIDITSLDASGLISVQIKTNKRCIVYKVCVR